METRRQLINLLYHQHQTLEFRSVHQRSLTTWTWLEPFQIFFFPSSFFTDETFLVKDLKRLISLRVSMIVDLKDNFDQLKISRYLGARMTEFEASHRLWTFKITIKVRWHSNQQILVRWKFRKQFDLNQ